MTKRTINLPEFPGIAIQHAEETTPWFQVGVMEALTKIQTVDVGVKLLESIAVATPAHRIARPGELAVGSVDFPKGVNVIIHPQAKRGFVQSGFKKVAGPGSVAKNWMVESEGNSYHIVKKERPTVSKGCPRFYFAGASSLNICQDPYGAGAVSHSRNGSGCVCLVSFNSSQIMTHTGVHATPVVVLAHELIHSYHCLYGIHAGKDEEPKTVGLDPFSGEEITENKFRDAFGMEARSTY